jgi:hypothetical protein
MRYLKWLLDRLRGRRAGQVVIAVALLLALPSLLSPLSMDEYVQAIRWQSAVEHPTGGGVPRFLNDCFVFASGDEMANRQEIQDGLGAWWPAPDFKVAFWRPLSAATFAPDHALWQGNAVLMHLHTLVWFAALLLALNALYRRFLPSPVATLALALYAWDDARGHVLSWVANRNALVAGVFGVLALIAYDRWRRDGWRPGAWLAPAALAGALLSAEMGLATAGFLFGYACFVDEGRLWQRLARLAPYVLVVVAWQVAYSTGAYGVSGSSVYLHPLQEPVAYFAKLLERAPILALGQLTPIGADFWGLYPPTGKAIVLLLALAVLIAVGRVSWVRGADDPGFRFWVVGAGLALLPISAMGAADRNLVFVGVGVAPALAVVFARAAERPPTSRTARMVVGTLVVFNLALAPLLLPVKSLTMLGMHQMIAPTEESVPRDATVRERTLVVVALPSEGPLYYTWARREAEGTSKPGTVRILATSLSAVSVTRVDERTLRVSPEDGYFASDVHQLLRDPSRDFAQGDTVGLSNMTATVTESTDDGRPVTVEFAFSAPLESPEWLWMRGEGLGLAAWTPPAVGKTVVVPAAL